MKKTQKGFTLVELLVVMAILGVLVTIIAGGFRSAQARGRDAERKSDLKQLSQSLELFFSDYGRYPSDDAGRILGCPYSPAGGSSPCTWGAGELTDEKTIYFKILPKDPTSSLDYYYRIVPASSNQKFQLFAHLENTEDKDCLGGDCVASPVAYMCGDKICNFSITSTNANATE
jgi:type II secretion system protein G